MWCLSALAIIVVSYLQTVHMTMWPLFSQPKNDDIA